MSDTNPLVSNATIQGAAKHIEGLMDTKGVITKPQEEEASRPTTRIRRSTTTKERQERR